MMPVLLKGDRLVVSKYPYGWSWVSPSFHIFPHWQGRLLGNMPERGDIVIVTPPGQSDDYIKRVIGLPGDTIEVRDGRLIINGKPVKSDAASARDGPGRRQRAVRNGVFRLPGGRGRTASLIAGFRSSAKRFPTAFRMTRSISARARATIIRPVKVPADHVFLMGDNRDRSADSRFGLGPPENGLGGPVPWENIGGRAEFITFSLDGTTEIFNPVSWFRALRSGRAGSVARGQKG